VAGLEVHAELRAVLGDDDGRRGGNGGEAEAFVLGGAVVGDDVKGRAGDDGGEGRADGVEAAVPAEGEELGDEDGAEAVHDESGESVALGVAEAVGVGDVRQAKKVVAQGGGGAEAVLTTSTRVPGSTGARGFRTIFL
jgi:hypothetical protein